MFDDFTRPDTLDWNGVLYRVLLSSAESGGAMSIVDSWTPAGEGPPRHVHDAEDETFVILSGRLRFWLDGVPSEKGPGETVFVPRGREHTFKVTEDGPARHIIILTPGWFEGFFADMAKGRYQIPRDMGPILDAAARHNLRFTGPPIGA